MAFCLYFALIPVPAAAETLQLYVQFLSRSFSCVSSIKNYVNGVKLLHLYNAVEFPHNDSFELSLLYKGLSRQKLHCVKQVLPITPSILVSFLKFLDMKSPLDITLWCCFVLAFFLFARKSNMVPPSVKSFDNRKHLQRKNLILKPWGLLICFKWSKTLQFGERKLIIPISAIPGSPLCPALAFSKMCSLIPAPLSSPAFVVPANGQLQTLTYSSYTGHLRHLLALAGHAPERYSGHSFRRGGATAAFKAGVPAELVRLHGDWHSDAYLRYLTIDLDQKLLVSTKIANFIHIN